MRGGQRYDDGFVGLELDLSQYPRAPIGEWFLGGEEKATFAGQPGHGAD